MADENKGSVAGDGSELTEKELTQAGGGDGTVDVSDLNIWNANRFQSVPETQELASDDGSSS